MLETEATPLGHDEPDGSRFRRHSIFERETAVSLPVPSGVELFEPAWLEQVRLDIEERGQFLAFKDGADQQLIRLRDGWTRIGRSAAADLRLDHSTVSRRHALIVCGEERGLRVLDDRSLNGIYLNGARIEWGALDDGDELQIGRFRLFVIDSTRVAAGA